MRLSDLQDLLPELNDLKRISSAGRRGSIASRLFRQSWTALIAGQDVDAVALQATARALAAARLGDIDHDVLSSAGLAVAEIEVILRSGIDAVAQPLGPSFAGELRDAVALPALPPSDQLPAFVDALDGQPRAGLTRPGRPRILLEPAESHAEHCMVVAVYGVLLAPTYGADRGRVFLAALAHHFHNAGLPDSGFTGEMLLGPHLAAIADHFNSACLNELPQPLRGAAVEARRILSDAETPEGRAFHAADTIDRVIQINHYMQAAALTPGKVLGEMELVHDGPVKSFQDDVLRQVGLL